jgi:hypothetical protein
MAQKRLQRHPDPAVRAQRVPEAGVRRLGLPRVPVLGFNLGHAASFFSATCYIPRVTWSDHVQCHTPLQWDHTQVGAGHLPGRVLKPRFSPVPQQPWLWVEFHL